MAILNIANDFADRQINCRPPGNVYNPDCRVTPNQGQSYTVSVANNPLPLRTTAMSLKWGSLNDRGPNAFGEQLSGIRPIKVITMAMK